MSVVELTIAPRPRDLGGFQVRRVLPHEGHRMVGPFIFLDHMGPASFDPGKGIDVRPHPHIGLATVTYLFEGEIFHRDTLGSAQSITPGAVNWMTAGRGIAHSERTAPAERGGVHRLHGLQSWVALPREHEETAPEFFHHPADTIPSRTEGGVTLRAIAGSAFGLNSPVRLYSPLLYVDIVMEPGARLLIPADHPERALYVVEGDLSAGEERLAPLQMAVFGEGETVALNAHAPTRAVLLGGSPFPEPRHIYWNFVSSSTERIEQAKRDWKGGRFGKVPGDEKEFIPLPQD